MWTLIQVFKAKKIQKVAEDLFGNKFNAYFYEDKKRFASKLLKLLEIETITKNDLSSKEPPKNALIFTSERLFPIAMRGKENSKWNHNIWIPLEPKKLIDKEKLEREFLEAAWKNGLAANYLARCGLKGAFVEVGVFWGKSFLKYFSEFHAILGGPFVGIDNFTGLRNVLPLEHNNSGGDFRDGSYSCTYDNTVFLFEIIGLPKSKYALLNYDLTKLDPTNQLISNVLQNKKISFLHIDVDTYEACYNALQLLTPYLENGALIRFDDWRMTRGDKRIGERGAALKWLEENPKIELIEFSQDGWQDQTFIYNNY